MINSSLFYNSVEPSFILDGIELIEYNPAFQNLLQFNPQRDKNFDFSGLLTHVRPKDICPEKFLQKILKEIFVLGNISEKLHFKGISSECITCEVSFTLFTSDNDKKLIFGICRNITYQPEECSFNAATQVRKNEQELETYRLDLEKLVEVRTHELQKSEAKLTDALKLVSLGTWEFDFNTQQFLIGDEVVNMMSGEKGKGLGNVFTMEEFFKYLHPGDMLKIQNANSRILKVKDPDYMDYMECRIIWPNGEIRTLYISIKILVDESGRHLKQYGTIQDITNIRRTEAENERLNVISEATSDIIAITHTNGRIIYLNQSGKSFFGVEGLKSLSHLNIDSLQHNKSKKVFKKVGLGQAVRKGIWSGENLIYGKDGREIPVSQVIIAHQSENGNVECYSTILRDISKQKNIEQDLIYKNNELDTFVYRASHDLRGPIASLLGLYTIVQYEISDPVSLRYFEMYNQQIVRLNSIIISLIEISRIKDRDAIKVGIDFKRIIDECISSFGNLPNFLNITFNIHTVPGLKYKNDQSIITTIMQNLIENAIKYSKPSLPSKVNIEVRELNGSISIKVTDNGIGIDRSIQDKIFNMFFRGTEQSMGSGLGLYILKNAVEKLKGQIILDSTLNIGTSFEIILPN